MKILLVNKFHYYKGGSETYYFALEEILRKHGHTVIHFSMQDEKNKYSDTAEYFVSKVDYNASKGFGNKINAVKNMFYSKEAYQKMKMLLEKERPDVVHLGLVHKQITYSIIDAIREYNIPIVHSVHDLIFICPCYTMLSNGDNCELCAQGNVGNCIKKKCVKNSRVKSVLAVIENLYIKKKQYYNHIDLYIAECNFYKKMLEKANFTHSAIISISNFLPPSKEISLLTNAGDYFLYFGRFSSEKGIMTLINAYKRSGCKTKLILVGGGPIEVEVKEFIKENSLEDKIILAGYQYGTDMESILKNAMAVVVPSEWYENCPYSILEAMGKSRIVIASDIAGLPELIKDGETGFLFEAKNVAELAKKIKKVEDMRDEERKTMNKKVYNYAIDNFSAELYYEKIIMIYRELLARKKNEYSV